MKAPVSGKVVEVNESVLKKPSLINESPYESWVIVVEPSNLEEDLEDLVHGDEVEGWLKAEIEEYKRRELIIS
jgi:glycine cleavage system H protein